MTAHCVMGLDHPATHVVSADNGIGESYLGGACLDHVGAVINRARSHFTGSCQQDAVEVTVRVVVRPSLWEAV